MPVVAIINQKGGVGKTTLATNLASALTGTGRVLLLDAAPQPSGLGWANLDPRPDPNPEVQGTDAGALVRQARAASEEYAWVVIDCPPGISRVNAEAIRASNVVLIPCKPRVWDAWACEDIVDAVKLRIEPIIYGGGQQNGLRSGTLPLPLCVGMAAAAGILRTTEGVKERSRISEQRDLFIRLLQNSGIPAQLNGPAGQWRHPGNANLRFSGFAAEDILGSVQPQLAASTGAACSSGIPEPSHVLRAMGLGNAEARIHRWTGMDGVRTAEGGEGVTGAIIRAGIRVDGRLAAVCRRFGGRRCRPAVAVASEMAG